MKWIFWSGLAAALAVAGFLWIGAPLLESLIPAGSRDGQRSAAPADPVSAAPPAARLQDTDDVALRQLLTDRLSLQAMINSPALPTDDTAFQYLGLSIQAMDPARLGAQLSGLIKGRAEGIVVTAALALDDGRTFPDLPILILRRGADGSFTRLFPSPDGPVGLTPLVARLDSTSATVSLSALLLETLNGDNADAVVSAAGRVVSVAPFANILSAPDQVARLSGEMSAFRSLLATLEPLLLDPLAALRFSFEGPEQASQRRAVYLDEQGQPSPWFDLTVTAQGGLLAEATDPLAVSPDGERGIGDLLTLEADLTAYALHATGVNLELACESLAGMLRDSLGLSPQDAAAALRPLMAARAVLGEDVSNCREAPEAAPPRRVAVDIRIRVLNGLTARLHGGRLGAARPLFRDRVHLHDISGHWLHGEMDGVLGNAAAWLARDASLETMGETLQALPVAKVACYHRTRRGGGTLVQLAGVRDLMALDAAFDDDGKVIGLSFGPVDQQRFCRAIAGSECYFAGAGVFGNVRRTACR
ncbi:hypothetical protein [Magnetospira sp. QH-2]|uniref:hypothetical protein n=1 Tax=Magnetospira sp. (strain QH-2) TaxID=1288970 RepID=UPI0003E812AE|nr:hypothetical protein [Magnetospira sp. QH-2]CCQ72486.1 protein of unknown function [Magnetospira sp. QH-2]